MAVITDCDLTDKLTVSNTPEISTPFVDIYIGTLINNTSSRVAVKRVRFPINGDVKADVLARRKRSFLDTVELICRAKHHNVLTVYGIFSMQDDVCIVEAWASRGTLAAYMEVTPDAPRLRFLSEVAAGLAYLHSTSDNKPPILHGNLHPGNVLLDERFSALVCDFGLNKILPDRHEGSIAVSSSLPRGRMIYVAPELHKPGVEFSSSSDVFSFAILSWAMYADVPPFLERGMVPAMVAMANGERPSRDVVKREDFHAQIWSVISDCWKEDPDARPTMVAVQERLLAASKIESSFNGVDDHLQSPTWIEAIVGSLRSLFSGLWSLWTGPVIK